MKIDDSAVSHEKWTAERMNERIVRYDELRPCYNAFVDTRTPGSEAKENFTIIGPGVSENPEQYVHIAEPHGFNIGGARQPPNCVNSQHSHDTAEVFVVQSGTWRFDLGEHGDDARVVLHPGDVISIPTRVFRGFTNVGEDIGYLWAVLGQDNPGRVTWAPHVFEMAKDYGLILLESGRLIDTTRGETVPEGERPMQPTSRDQVKELDRYTPEQAHQIVWLAANGKPGETALIGQGGVFDWYHGFALTRVELAAGEDWTATPDASLSVLYVQQGSLTLSWDDLSVELGTGDTISVPANLRYTLSSQSGAVAFRVRKDG